MARGRTGRGHLGEDVRLAEGGKPLLPLGPFVGSDGAPKHALGEQDEGSTESLRVELIGEGEVGQVSAVPDKERLVRVHKYSLHRGSTVLKPERESQDEQALAVVIVAVD